MNAGPNFLGWNSWGGSWGGPVWHSRAFVWSHQRTTGPTPIYEIVVEGGISQPTLFLFLNFLQPFIFFLKDWNKKWTHRLWVRSPAIVAMSKCPWARFWTLGNEETAWSALSSKALDERQPISLGCRSSSALGQRLDLDHCCPQLLLSCFVSICLGQLLFPKWPRPGNQASPLFQKMELMRNGARFGQCLDRGPLLH